MTDMTTPPTDERIIQEFKDYVAERAQVPVQWAQAVSDVSFARGCVTLTLDPLKAKAQHWALVDENTPNLAEVFGAPVKDNTEHASWLRRRVHGIEVNDTDGRVLYTARIG